MPPLPPLEPQAVKVKRYSTGVDGSVAVVAVMSMLLGFTSSGATAKVIGSGAGGSVSAQEVRVSDPTLRL